MLCSWEDAPQPWDPLDSDGGEEDFEDTVRTCLGFSLRAKIQPLNGDRRFSRTRHDQVALVPLPTLFPAGSSRVVEIICLSSESGYPFGSISARVWEWRGFRNGTSPSSRSSSFKFTAELIHDLSTYIYWHTGITIKKFLLPANQYYYWKYSIDIP